MIEEKINLPEEERHRIIIIINGLTKMKGNATNGAVVELITNVNSANERVEYVEEHPEASQTTDDMLHMLLDKTEDFIVFGNVYDVDEDNGAVAATIDWLNDQFEDIL